MTTVSITPSKEKDICKGYYCPICNGVFNSFLPTGFRYSIIKEKNIIGAGYRENAICPRCLSVDRERLVFLYLMKYESSLFKNKTKLLHIAPEKTLNKVFLQCENIDYISADLNHPRAKIKMDITNINYDENTFDCIICNHVLEHIPDDKKAMKELFRVLNNGGFGVLQVPISYAIKETEEDLTITTDEERIKRYGQRDHVRLYGNDYFDRLQSVGFKVHIIDVVAKLKNSYAEKCRLIKDEKIFLVRK